MRQSTRLWRVYHERVSLAALRREQSAAGNRWRSRSRTVETAPGGIMAINAGDLHETLQVYAPTDFDLVRFCPELLNEASRELGGPPGFALRAPVLDHPAVFSALRALVNAVASAHDPLELECAYAYAVYRVISHAGESPRQLKMTNGCAADPALKRVRERLVDDPAERPAMSELMAIAGMTNYRLCQRFKLAFGVSMGEYWNAHRLSRTLELLRGGEPLWKIIASFNYTHGSHFWRVFRAAYGVAPQRWHALLRENDWAERGQADQEQQQGSLDQEDGR